MYLGDTVGQPPKKGPAQNDEIAVAVDHPIPSPVGLFQLGSNSGENRNFFFILWHYSMDTPSMSIQIPTLCSRGWGSYGVPPHLSQDSMTTSILPKGLSKYSVVANDWESNLKSR